MINPLSTLWSAVSSSSRKKSPLELCSSEIWLIIFAYLSEVDQICFGLTCIYFYSHFTASLTIRPPNQRLPKLLVPKENYEILCNKIELERQPRTQLLRRLQNSRWKYCIECLTLHPHSAWKKPKGHTCPKCEMLRGNACMPYTRRVDICPCRSITLQDRDCIVNALQSNNTDQLADGFAPIELNGSVIQTTHRCELVSPRAKVDIETTLHTYDMVDCPLWVANIYRFYLFKSYNQRDKLYPICPHKETEKWLKGYFSDAGVDFVGWSRDHYPYGDCSIDPPKTEPYFLEVRIERRLNDSAWVYENWYSKCNDNKRWNLFAWFE